MSIRIIHYKPAYWSPTGGDEKGRVRRYLSLASRSPLNPVGVFYQYV